MPEPPHRCAFLLSQLGAVAATAFAELLREFDLSPGEAGVLRLLARQSGLSQRALADRLGAVPSRVVVLIDSLERRALVERVRSVEDRRHHELRLTDAGQAMVRELRRVADRHESVMTGSLADPERVQLAALLGKLAAAQGLDPQVHPGYGARGRPRRR